MTNRNGAYGSGNQNAPERHGKAGAGMSGDNNKGTEYNSKRGSKSSLKNPQNHD
ncbi:imidazoleglycerol-phosphate dehydratase [Bacillus marinisedimentorum]|uniref:imidazoleglycerol-phosphate dehydratase n=1 Tax=Bacillus marinisedimentorum TaxID=1821260 RepID=UPI000ABE4A03|nr:imidazoleglycerol-phosphate dehydratase [Bacillus marinisedimentorum]